MDARRRYLAVYKRENNEIGALFRTFGGDVVVLAGHPLPPERQRLPSVALQTGPKGLLPRSADPDAKREIATECRS